MDDIHRFRTKTLDLKGTNPIDGTSFAHSVKNAEGKIVSGPGSKTFHNELQGVIQNSKNLNEFNTGVEVLIDKWKIDKSLIPSFPTN